MVVVVVSSEDGSVDKTYTIRVKRFSTSDAALSELSVDGNTLSPPFNSSIDSYAVDVPASCSTIKVAAKPADVKMVVAMKCESSNKPESIVLAMKDGRANMDLGLGTTSVIVEVTAPNGKDKRLYSVVINRKHWSCVTADPPLNSECPVCLGIMHVPITIKGSKPKHTFCASCIGEMTRTNKQDPLSRKPLESDWASADREVEKSTASLVVPCGYSPRCDQTVPLPQLAAHMKDCKSKMVEGEVSVGVTAL